MKDPVRVSEPAAYLGGRVSLAKALEDPRCSSQAAGIYKAVGVNGLYVKIDEDSVLYYLHGKGREEEIGVVLGFADSDLELRQLPARMGEGLELSVKSGALFDKKRNFGEIVLQDTPIVGSKIVFIKAEKRLGKDGKIKISRGLAITCYQLSEKVSN